MIINNDELESEIFGEGLRNAERCLHSEIPPR